MTIQPQTRSTPKPPNLAAGIASRLAAIVIALGMQMAILFLAAGRFDWIWAWVYLGISLLILLINSTFLLRTNPETIAERGHPQERKDWDKVVSALWGLAQYLALPLVAGLDAHFGWSGTPGAAWHLAGAFLYAGGLGLFSWAMITNAYFSTAARIQTDRGQTVCRTGPYRFVRHPGYSGAILQALGIPILLGSFWTLIPAGAAVVCIVARTVFEDRMLQNELAGYKDYAKDVAFRLIPGIW
jgi:protein-S-isoprenylcysteine O-methyltransferase Ste14